MRDRVPDHRFAEAIDLGYRYLPARIARRFDTVRIVCGVDPVFAGYTTTEDTDDGRSYRDTAHVCYPHHLNHRPADDRPITVMFPHVPHPATVVHELAHALDWQIGCKHNARPVTDYARTDRYEAFAEAFTAWCFAPGYYGDPDVLHADGATRALFRELSSC